MEYDAADGLSQPVLRSCSPREEVLSEALECVMKSRNNDYGPPDQDFTRTAAIWTALFGPKLRADAAFDGKDVALAMIALKLSRACWADKRDNFVDAAGYAACGWECAVRDEERQNAAAQE